MTELKSCPFCGGKAVVDHYQWWDSDEPPNLHDTWQIGCAEEATKEHCCLGRLCHSRGYKTESEAIAAWNRRAEHTATRISVPREGHTAIGHYECGECRGVVGAGDKYCRHCGSKLEEGWK